MRQTFRAAAAAAGCLLIGACRGDVPTPAAAAMSREQRAALADTIRQLSDSIIQAGTRLDAAGLVARFRNGAEAAFGGAGALVLSREQMRDNLAAGYRNLRSQRLEVVEQRVAVVGPDAAVTTGWGNFAAVDTAENRARGIQAFTFAWARGEDGWQVVQAHFSAQLTGVDRRNANQPDR